MIIITGTVSTAFAASPDDIVALCIEHSARSRAEPGCISHNVHVDCEDTTRLFFHEIWQDEAAVSAHFAVPESQDFVKRLTTLIGERPEMQMYRTQNLSPNDLD
ncbi:antibiotic biosynthesis monooxygenase [Parasphingorhabdus sp.]|uniref:putative quinol monooxygenase n=1 Tax=Parasphingorhabdus sp. TaxID=2709688 RepID=UPI0032665CEC